MGLESGQPLGDERLFSGDNPSLPSKARIHGDHSVINLKAPHTGDSRESDYPCQLYS